MATEGASAYRVDFQIGCDKCGKHTGKKGMVLVTDAEMTTAPWYKGNPRVKTKRLWPFRKAKPVTPLKDIVDEFVHRLDENFNSWETFGGDGVDQKMNWRVRLYFFKLMLFDVMQEIAQTQPAEKIKKAFGPRSAWFKDDEGLMLISAQVNDPDHALYAAFFSIICNIFAHKYMPSQAQNSDDSVGGDQVDYWSEVLVDNMRKALGKNYDENFDGHQQDLESYLSQVSNKLTEINAKWKRGHENFVKSWDRELKAIQQNKDGTVEITDQIKNATREGVIAEVIESFNLQFANNECRALLVGAGIDQIPDHVDAHDIVLYLGRIASSEGDTDKLVYFNSEAHMDLKIYECGPWVSGLLYRCLLQVRKQRESAWSRYMTQTQRDDLAHNIWLLRNRELQALKTIYQRNAAHPTRPPPRTPPRRPRPSRQSRDGSDTASATRTDQGQASTAETDSTTSGSRRSTGSKRSRSSRVSQQSQSESSQYHTASSDSSDASSAISEDSLASASLMQHISDEAASFDYDALWLSAVELHDLVMPGLYGDTTITKYLTKLNSEVVDGAVHLVHSVTQQQVQAQIVETIKREFDMETIQKIIERRATVPWQDVDVYEIINFVRTTDSESYDLFIKWWEVALREKKLEAEIMQFDNRQ